MIHMFHPVCVDRVEKGKLERELQALKGSVWESDKLILNDGRWFPETADVIFFSEKFVF